MTMNDDVTQVSKFPRDLPVALNDHELEVYGMQLAQKVKEGELLEGKKKADNAKWSALIKAANQEIKRLADARAKGEELRPVMCAERLRGNVIEIVRLDTNAVVDTRPADMSDLQTSIPGVSGKSLVPDMRDDDEIPPNPFEDAPIGQLHGDDGAVVGEGVASSSGAGVFVGTEPVCPSCSEPIMEGDGTEMFEGELVHSACVPAGAADDDAPPSDEVSGGATIGERAARKTRERSAKKNGTGAYKKAKK